MSGKLRHLGRISWKSYLNVLVFAVISAWSGVINTVYLVNSGQHNMQILWDCSSIAAEIYSRFALFELLWICSFQSYGNKDFCDLCQIWRVDPRLVSHTAGQPWESESGSYDSSETEKIIDFKAHVLLHFKCCWYSMYSCNLNPFVTAFSYAGRPIAEAPVCHDNKKHMCLYN